jgi:hypothetical protein
MVFSQKFMGFPKKKAHGFSHGFHQKDHGFLSFCTQKIMGFNQCSNESNGSGGSPSLQGSAGL